MNESTPMTMNTNETSINLIALTANVTFKFLKGSLNPYTYTSCKVELLTEMLLSFLCCS